jgi:hypothetical protein
MADFNQGAIKHRKPLFFAVAAACAVLFAVQTERSQTRQAGPAPSFPAVGNLSQVMRGILFPNANLIFNVQTHDPSEKKPGSENANAPETFNWVTWGSNLYSPWELVDYAAVTLAESAPLMLTPGRQCENGKPVPVDDPDWIKFTQELAEAGKAAYKAAQTRNQEAVSDATNVIADSCSHCHQVFRDKRGPGVDPRNPVTSKANRCMK